MKISYDKKADVMNIRFQEGKYELSEEVAEGIILDKTKEGKNNNLIFKSNASLQKHPDDTGKIP